MKNRLRIDTKMEFTSRYGKNLPDPDSMCSGDCEGTGWVPVEEGDAEYAREWAEAEKLNPTEDGWHFVECKECGGSGRKKSTVLE